MHACSTKMACLVLCTLSASAFIEPSLHQLDFLLEIFNGDKAIVMPSYRTGLAIK